MELIVRSDWATRFHVLAFGVALALVAAIVFGAF